jgi:hypothetical protein
MSSDFHEADGPELPADLAALGEQLQADALRLGNVYPACKAPVAPGSIEASARRVPLIAIATAAAMLLISAGMFWLMDPPAKLGGAKPAAATHAADPTNQDAALVHSPDVQPVSFRPAMAEVNGPELEGLLDLLDDQGHAAAVISF